MSENEEHEEFYDDVRVMLMLFLIFFLLKCQMQTNHTSHAHTQIGHEGQLSDEKVEGARSYFMPCTELRSASNNEYFDIQ